MQVNIRQSFFANALQWPFLPNFLTAKVFYCMVHTYVCVWYNHMCMVWVNYYMSVYVYCTINNESLKWQSLADLANR